MAQEVREVVEAKETKESKDAKSPKSSKAANKGRDIKKFFSEIKGELRKVIWPDRSQLVNNTLTVLTICFLIGAIIWAADIGYEKVYQVVFK